MGAGFQALADVFGVLGVGGGDDDGVGLGLLEHELQGGEALWRWRSFDRVSGAAGEEAGDGAVERLLAGVAQGGDGGVGAGEDFTGVGAAHAASADDAEAEHVGRVGGGGSHEVVVLLALEGAVYQP